MSTTSAKRSPAAKQGAYKIDATRSTIALDDTKGFPKNTEVEAILTFTTDGVPKGKFVGDVTPDPHAMTVRERQSFIELPPPGFTPRRFDPRSGYFPPLWRDYDAPLGEPLDQQFILRHRLIKRDPNCKSNCEPVTPIQYYVDRGAPEPIRSALLEGARWWDTAFQAAGWAKGTFRVDLLPADADPMDVRYNIIQWVHRYTRGWSYGEAVADPRTGEIIKGNVTLGSLRGRQDYLIAEALLSPYVSGKSITPQNDPMLQMVLARLRQLAAHETGHTLGLAHNFAASSIAQGDSVMDYPHPYITLGADGVPDLSHAYAAGIGDWDKVSIDYGYREFPSPHRRARPPSTRSSPTLLTPASTSSPMTTRARSAPRIRMRTCGTTAPTPPPNSTASSPSAAPRSRASARTPSGPARRWPSLKKLWCRSTCCTATRPRPPSKLIGGLDYRYNLRGDGQPDPQIVAPELQDRALKSVLKTLTPETLMLPESLLKILPPAPPGYPRTQESFPSHTGLTFDPLAAAETAADLTLSALLDPARASRLVQYHMRIASAPSIRGLLEAISKTTAERPEAGHTMSSDVARAVESRALEAMFALAERPRGRQPGPRRRALAHRRRAQAAHHRAAARGHRRGHPPLRHDRAH